MNFVLFLVAIPVCISDMSTFTIPNIYSKIIFYAALIQLSIFGLGRAQQIVMSIFILTLLLLTGTGMGDIKILALILTTNNLRVIELTAYILCFAAVHIVILTGVLRRVPTKIAFAPSIFIGLGTYLAAR